MSDIIRLTQNFYQQCQKATNMKNPQELIEANHVGWGSIKTQKEGFKVATDLPWIDWKEVDSVLDIGCGYGGLLEFLTTTKLYQGKYQGIDIMPNHIIQAVLNYSNKQNSCFQTRDFMEQDWDALQFDVVISLGGICVNHDYPLRHGQKSLEYAQRFIIKAVHFSRSALSLYFPKADKKTKKDYRLMAYYEIAEIEAMIRESCGSRLEDLIFVSYPEQTDLKTIAKVKLSS